METNVTKKPQADGAPIYQLRVTLKYVQPLVWRRIQVPGDVTLQTLHQILQEAMGWTDSHLHQFLIRGERYGIPHPELDMSDENDVTLAQGVSRGTKSFAYEYDFGDGWRHEVKVENIMPMTEPTPRAVCLGGGRACPPEDCGGSGGYAELLEALGDPGHPRHAELLEWVGGDFDPEAFHLKAVNRALRRIRLSGPRRS
jgi:Plasmid pRiA4b ORF-3-like protein